MCVIFRNVPYLIILPCSLASNRVFHAVSSLQIGDTITIYIVFTRQSLKETNMFWSSIKKEDVKQIPFLLFCFWTFTTTDTKGHHIWFWGNNFMITKHPNLSFYWKHRQAVLQNQKIQLSEKSCAKDKRPRQQKQKLLSMINSTRKGEVMACFSLPSLPRILLNPETRRFVMSNNSKGNIRC